MKRIILYSIAVLLAFLLTLPLILTWAANSNPAKHKLCELIAEKTGIRVSPVSMTVSIFPKTGVTLTSLEITADPVKNLKIETLKVDINPLKLLSGTVYIEQVVIENPGIEALLPLMGLLGGSRPAASGDSPFNMENIFSFLPENQNTIRIILKKASSSFFGQLNAAVNLSRSERRIFLQAQFDRIRISADDILPDNPHPSLRFSEIKADQLMLTASAKHPFEIKAKLFSNNLEITSPDQSAFIKTSKVNTDLSYKNEILHINVPLFRMDYPEVTFGFDFLWNKPEKNARILFTGKDVHAGQVRHATTAMLKTHVSDTLFNIVRDGFVDTIDVSFAASHPAHLLDENNLVLNGRIKKGLVKIPETDLTAREVTGKVTVLSGILSILDLNGRIQNTQIESGSLDVDLIHYADVPFKGSFDLDVDLNQIPAILISLLPGTTLSKELEKVHHVKGRCRSQLELELKTGSPEPLVRVRTNDFSAAGEYERIPGTILIENLQFQYADEKIDLKNGTGMIHSNSFSNMNLSVDIQKDYLMDIFSGSGIICLDTTLPWLLSYETPKRFLPLIPSASGQLFFDDLRLSGAVMNPEQWMIRTSGKGAIADLTCCGEEKEIKDMSFDYVISEKQLEISRLKFDALHYGWLKSYVDNHILESILFPVSVSDALIRADSDRIDCRAEISFKPDTKIVIHVSGSTAEQMQIRSIKMFEPETTNADFKFSSIDDPNRFDFSGTFNTKTLYRLLLPDSPTTKTLNRLTRGEPVIFSTPQNNADNPIQINAGFIDFDALTSLKKNASEDARISTKKRIVLTADKAVFKNLIFNDLKTRINIEDNHTYMRINHAGLCGLEASGYFNFKDRMIYGKLPVFAVGKENIQDLLSCLLKKENFMDGQYSFRCDLAVNSPENKAVENVNGTLSFDANDGRIYKLTLLSRILSVLNVSKVFQGKIPDITQQGFAYKQIQINADINKSIIHLNKAVIDGLDMTMIFTGKIDPLNDQINLTCLVAPFKTVDLIIEKIPIVNTLLGGRLISVPVQATGKLSDPDVIPLHPSAVGKGLINMMGTILKTPVKLLEKLTNEP